MSLNKIKINNTTTVNAGIYDISKETNQTYTNLASALGNEGSNVPIESRESGMIIKFIQVIPDIYKVIYNKGIETQPSGTALNSASTITDGKYTANQLTDFSSVAPLPSNVDDSVTYYIAVTEIVDEQEVTTYTTWNIIKIQSSSNKYVQFRYMLEYENTIESNAAFIDIYNW